MGGWQRKCIRALLIPAVYFLALAVGWTAISLPLRLDRRTALIPALAGFAAAIWLLLLRLRFIRVYVFGHELTHWLTAKLFRRKTGRFAVGANGGSVEIENPNELIVLAPYIVPVYTLAVIGIYGTVKAFMAPLPEWAVMAFCAAMGATYAFHLVLTALALRAGQKDLQLFGPVFSMGVILLGNVLLIFLAFVVAGKHWDTAFGSLWRHIHALASLIMQAARTVLDAARQARSTPPT